MASEGARKRAARRWTNHGLQPSPSSDDSSDEDAAALTLLDDVHGDKEAAAIQQAFVLSAMKAREVRQVRGYKAACKEPGLRCMKRELVVLDDE